MSVIGKGRTKIGNLLFASFSSIYSGHSLKASLSKIAMKLQPGGRPGGEMTFIVGLLMTAIGVWLFFDSIRLVAGHKGIISGMMGRGGRGLGQTTSMGVILVPLFAGVVALFMDSTKKWAWGLTWIGLLILVVEILSNFRFHFNVKGSHAILLLLMIAGGIGLMLRSYLLDRSRQDPIDRKIEEMKRRKLKEGRNQ